MCSSFEAGWYLRRTDFLYHSTLGFRTIKEKKNALGVQRPGQTAGYERILAGCLRKVDARLMEKGIQTLMARGRST
jgi:hypothetical protein